MVPWNFNMQNLNIFYVYYGEDERRPNKKKPFSTSNGFPYSSEKLSIFSVLSARTLQTNNNNRF